MEIDEQTLVDLCYGYDYDGSVWKEMTEETLEDSSRWSLYYSRVYQHTPSGKYFELLWERGATEYQEVELNPRYYEVEPVQKTVTVYKEVKQAKG